MHLHLHTRAYAYVHVHVILCVFHVHCPCTCNMLVRKHNEQVGIQIEEPFSILPLEAFCNSAIAACNQEMLGAVSSGVFAQPTRDEEENVYGNVVPVRARAFENNGAVQ